jgi:hypothetical protein
MRTRMFDKADNPTRRHAQSEGANDIELSGLSSLSRTGWLRGTRDCVPQGYGFRSGPLCSGAWITARMPQNCRCQGGSLPVHEHRRCYVVYEGSDEYMEAL